MPIAKTVTNFYPAESTQTLSEILAKLRTDCNLTDDGNRYVVKSTPPNVIKGVYRLEVNVVDGVSGVNINLDGTPLLNEPRPQLTTAEEVLTSIHQLYTHNCGTGAQDLMTLAEGENKIVLRKTRAGKVELVITGPSTERMVRMMQEDVDLVHALMDRILNATYPN